MQLKNAMWLVAPISWLLAKSCLFDSFYFWSKLKKFGIMKGKKQWDEQLMGRH